MRFLATTWGGVHRALNQLDHFIQYGTITDRIILGGAAEQLQDVRAITLAAQAYDTGIELLGGEVPRRIRLPRRDVQIGFDFYEGAREMGWIFSGLGVRVQYRRGDSDSYHVAHLLAVQIETLAVQRISTGSRWTQYEQSTLRS